MRPMSMCSRTSHTWPHPPWLPLWNNPGNAEKYDEFARTYPLYRDTSRDLVELAGLERTAVVVDLACGTGITTEAILVKVKRATRVTALDASEPMLAIARKRIQDSRVQWVHATAVDLPQHATRADAIVCNASMWQLDMERAIAAAAESLKPSGRLVFNVGCPFLASAFTAEEDRTPESNFQRLIREVAIQENGYMPPLPWVPRRRRMTPDSIEGMIVNAGLVAQHTRVLEYDYQPEARLAWLGIPVVAQSVLPGLPYEKQLEVFAAAYERLEKSTIKSRWLAFVAYKPDV